MHYNRRPTRYEPRENQDPVKRLLVCPNCLLILSQHPFGITPNNEVPVRRKGVETKGFSDQPEGVLGPPGGDQDQGEPDVMVRPVGPSGPNVVLRGKPPEMQMRWDITSQ